MGLDYHSTTVRVCVLSADGQVLLNRSVPSDIEAVVAAIEPLGNVCGVALEACCGSASFADALIARTGWRVQQAHPGYCKRMRQNPDKTDKSDAYMLADLIRIGYLPCVWLAPPEIRDLRLLVRHRQQLVDHGRAIKLRIRALLREHRIKASRSLWTRGGLAWLRALEGLPPNARYVLDRHGEDLAYALGKLAGVTTRLRQVCENDDVVLRLLEQPGIGLVTACTLRAEVGRFDRFGSGKQLARFCGLSPRNHSSDQHQATAGLIRAGNPQLRAVLIEASHRLMRLDLRWRAYRDRLKAAGKPVCLIAAAVANRWVRGLYHALLETPSVRWAA